LEGRYDVKLWRSFTRTRPDGSSVHHQTGTVKASHCIQFQIGINGSSNELTKEGVKKILTGHQNTWHIFVASRNDNHTIEVMTTTSGLDLICYQVPGLK
jgi:hypothetical protein